VVKDRVLTEKSENKLVEQPTTGEHTPLACRFRPACASAADRRLAEISVSGRPSCGPPAETRETRALPRCSA